MHMLVLNALKLIDDDFVVSLHVFLGPGNIVSACVFKCAPWWPVCMHYMTLAMKTTAGYWVTS